MIEPLLAGDALLEDVRRARSTTEHLHLWWLGQSGFLAKWNSIHLLFDPYLSDSLTLKYANTDKPHIRMTRIPLEPSRLGFVDIVTSSHQHTDHLDADTLQPLRLANPKLRMVAPAAHRALVLERSGLPQDQITFLSDGDSAEVGFEIHAVPAAHEQIERNAAGEGLYLGYVVKFGKHTVYHSGDTIPHPDIVAALAGSSIDVAILPINGRGPERRVAGNLWGKEAAELALGLGARLVVPCHYEMFTFNTATTNEFIESCQRLGQPFRVLRCGERLTM